MIADKLISTSKVMMLSVLIALPLNAQAEYYLVYGPAAPVVCNFCERPVYRPVYKHKYKSHCRTKHVYKRTYVKKRSHYRVEVYYPVAVYERNPCGGCCGCGGFMGPAYYWAPAPARVYYTRPEDRLVGNRYDESYIEPSMDTGTADNDIY